MFAGDSDIVLVIVRNIFVREIKRIVFTFYECHICHNLCNAANGIQDRDAFLLIACYLF